MTKIAIVTLGCPKNEVYSEYMLGVLSNSNYEFVDDPIKAEVVIVNTCSFITSAKQEALETILQLASLKNSPYLIVTGCMVQQHGKELIEELPEVSAFIGTEALTRLPDVIEKILNGQRVFDVPGYEEILPELPRFAQDKKPYAYLKISEGCNNCCTYCTIPSIKGPYRSRPMEYIVKEARELAESGIKELILVAQDTTAYGIDIYGEYRLPTLLCSLAQIPELYWLRILYTYPERITPELIEVMATEPKVVPYLDIPLQHISEDILRRMGRPGTGTIGIKVIEDLRRSIPELALRSTFIVGFPGEEEKDFQLLLDFLSSTKIDWVGAFKFSPEEGTIASELPNQVEEEIKEERYQLLMLYQQSITRACNERWLGQKMKVLIDGKSVGRSFRQAPEVDGLIYLNKSNVPLGSIVTAKLTHVYEDYDFKAEIEM
ncbi:MAG: ribosomal protein methylthiotransferase [Clostridia bacterium]|nr:ribosomal protein methylthiotransferase [Clostridia bacterium]